MLGYQFLMCAVFDDATMIKNNYLVGIANGRQPMGNDEGGATLHNGVHASLYELLPATAARAIARSWRSP